MTYTVSLENFSGPLDLLLYLVKQEEVEIHEIPISVICDRYLEYLTSLESLDVDLASEFLVMAATLMLIKSRSLLPAGEEIDLEEELDPEDELIQQLLEYKQFKMASRDLEGLAKWRSQVFPFTAPKLPQEEIEVELEEIDLWDLVRAFATMLQETGIQRAPRVITNEKPLREYIEDVFTTVRSQGRITFVGLFEGERDRMTVIGRFLALLELMKRKLVRSVQAGSFDSIEIVLEDDRDLSLDEILNMEAELLAPASEEELEFMDQLDENDLANGDENTQDSTSEHHPSSSVQDSAEDAEVSHGQECT